MVGTTLGHYEILESLGAGGMGEVYLGQDRRLSRRVAIKVLPPELVADAQRVARFRREAEILAALNHQHVAQIYGLEEDRDTTALVLELVEGPTLEERLASGPLPSDEALAIARQLAEGLDAAHERGIVHRDLKPANIKIGTGEGGSPMVKILDFGLAKALESSPEGSGERGAPSAADSPTMGLAATQAGLILGTAGYMSPEQAKGHPADRRADIWSFGVVLYEMLTGAKLFDAETVSEVLAAVLMKKLDLGELPPATPPAVRHLLSRCLVRDPRSRLRDIGEARVALEGVLAGAAESSVIVAGASPATSTDRPAAMEAVPRRGLRAAFGDARIAWAVAFLAISIAAGSALIGPGSRGAPEGDTAADGPVRFEIYAPPGVTLGTTAEVSPDGRAVAFTGREADDERMIWIRALESLDARPVPGTQGGSEPFWSPDGGRLGFFADGRLRAVELATGSVTDLAAVAQPHGGSWNRDDVIIFGGNSVIQRVSATGGGLTPVTALDVERRENQHLWPRFLPDGHHFTFLGDELTDTLAALWVASIDSPGRTLLVEEAVHAAYVPPGFLLHTGTDRTRALGLQGLIAQPFDLDRLELSGEPFSIAGATTFGRPHRFGFSASEGGTIVYQPAPADRGSWRLAWFDAAGDESPVGETLETVPDWFDLSVDDRRVLISSDGEIWSLDLADAAARRLTLPGAGNKATALWSPTGDRIAFLTLGDPREVRVRDLQSGLERVIAGGSGQEFFLHDWSRDGDWLIAEGGDGIYALPVSGEGEVVHIVEWAGDINSPTLSPDGAFLAYSIVDSGNRNIFVAPFEEGATGVRVSTQPGLQPRWGPDGKTLYFLNSEAELVAVDIASGATISAAPVRRLFQAPMQVEALSFAEVYYEVSSDGSRFLFRVPVGEAPERRIEVILNWPSTLQ